MEAGSDRSCQGHSDSECLRCCDPPRNFRLHSVRWLALMLLCCFFRPTCGRDAHAQFAPGIDPSEVLRQGATLALQGRLAEAEQLLDTGLRQSPRDIDLMTELAKVKGRLGEGSQSVDLFREVLRKRPLSSEAHRHLALALADSNQLPEALREVTQSVALAPASGSAHSARGLILYGLNRMDDAAKEFAAATTYSPNLADAWFYWALIQTASGDARAATDSLQRVVSLQPRNARAYALLAKSLQQQSRLDEAREAWRRTLDINPDDSPTVYMAARSLARSDPAESKRLMARFLDLQKLKEETDRISAAVSSLGNQANLAMQTQNWAAAKALLDQAITECGECNLIADLHKNLGLTECHQGDLVTGKRELDLALELKPADRDTVAALRWIAMHESK